MNDWAKWPFQRDPEGADDLYALIGRMVVVWGKLERTLDITLETSMQLPGTEAVIDKMPDGPPLNFQKKQNLYKRMFRECPTLTTQQTRATNLADEALKFHRRRSQVIHAEWRHFTQKEPLTLYGQHRQRKRGSIVRQELYVTKESLLGDIQEVAKLLYTGSLLLTFAFNPPETDK